MLRHVITRYHSHLAWQLILPQLLLTVLLGLAGVVLVHHHTHQQMIEQLRSRGQFISEALTHAAANASSMESFGAYVEALGSARGVELILITGGTPQAVVAATDWAWVGRKVDTLPADDYRADIEGALTSGQVRFDPEQGGGDVFDYSLPIDLQPLLAGPCVMMAHLNVAEDKRAAEQAARMLSVTLLALVFGLLTLQINAVRRRILLPQRRLLEAMHARELGQTDMVPVKGSDELAQLSGAYNQLITKLGQNETTLLQQQAALVAADRAKTEFLANLSHEIRTPLNGLMGITDLLELEETHPERLKLLGEMRGAGEALRELLERILDLAQLDMGRVILKPQPMALPEILRSAGQRMQQSAMTKGLTLSVSLDPTVPEAVVVDGKRMMQLIQLLLDNAVKFSEHGDITLSARLSPNATKSIEIDVADQGIGISPEMHERIFESFFQVDGSATRKAGGNGLGLAIVKRLVALMGGTIVVLIRPQGGTVMRLTLPFEPAACDEVL